MHSSRRIRIGAVVLGTAAVLLATFPVARSLSPLGLGAPVETRAVARSAIAAAPRLLSHLMGMLALALLLVGGGLALRAVRAADRDEPRAFGPWSGSWPEPHASCPPSAWTMWHRADSGATGTGGGHPRISADHAPATLNRRSAGWRRQRGARAALE
jgi:hypothetical protein